MLPFPPPNIVYCFQRLVLAIGLAYYPQNAYRLSPPPCHVLKSDVERRVFKRSKKEIYMSVLGIDNRKSIFYDASNKSHCHSTHLRQLLFANAFPPIICIQSRRLSGAHERNTMIMNMVREKKSIEFSNVQRSNNLKAALYESRIHLFGCTGGTRGNI